MDPNIQIMLPIESTINNISTTNTSTNINNNNNVASTSTIANEPSKNQSFSSSKSMKHFKKSMIVEYERIESNGGIDDSSSHSTSSSSSSSSGGGGGAGGGGSSNSSNGGESFHSATSFANTVISKSSLVHYDNNDKLNQNENDKENDLNEEKNSKKRKRKSIDEHSSNLPNFSLSTIVAAAAAVAATSKNNFNSDIYEDESSDSIEHNHTNKSSNLDKKSLPVNVKSTIKSVKRELNDFSGEFSDSNARSDYDMPINSSHNKSYINKDEEQSKLKEVKRKKTDDSLTETVTSINSTKDKKPNKENKSAHDSFTQKLGQKSKNIHNESADLNKNKVLKKSEKPEKLERERLSDDKTDLVKNNKLEVYCICKSSDSTRFMIACDKCDEWYHGDCVGVTQSLSKKIKTFYCHLCRQKKNSLKIKYNSQFQEMSRNLTKEHVRQQENTAGGEALLKFFKETQVRKKKESELLKSISNSSQSLKTLSNEKNEKKSSKLATNPSSSISSNENKSSASSSIKPSNSSINTTNHNKNSIHESSVASIPSKTSSTENINEIDQEISSPLISSLSLNSTKLYGKTKVSGEDIANFFSAITKLSCDVQLATTVNNSTNLSHDDKPSTALSPSSVKKEASSPTKTKTEANFENRKSKSFNMENSNSAVDENESDSNEDSNESHSNVKNKDSDESDSSDSDFGGYGRTKSRLKSDDSSNKTTGNGKNKHVKSQQNKKMNSKKLQNGQLTSKTKSSNNKTNQKSSGKISKQPQQKKRLNRNSSSMNHNDLDELDRVADERNKTQKKEPRQCIGPECEREAFESSKYCSYECGMRLAKDRLVTYLKSSLDKYNSEPSLANKLNQSELERINFDIDNLKAKLGQLEKKHEDLDKIISKAKYAKINPNVEKEREKFIDSSETEIYCVSCGQICSERQALKHMEKCFNKLESQAFFGSFYKTHIEGKSMFCDFYNTQTKMYCKRLKVMCPEHEKEKKVNDDEVCGCPLAKTVEFEDSDDSENDICLAPKRTCSIHFKWEKLRRAQIDLEKLRAWLKMEELLEQKKMHEASLNQRGGLLSVLLHQTTATNNPQMNSDNIQTNEIKQEPTMEVDIKSENKITTIVS